MADLPNKADLEPNPTEGAFKIAIGLVYDVLAEVRSWVIGHVSDNTNPHDVTASQVGAVATDDAVDTISPGKVVKRRSDGKLAGDITGNAATVGGKNVGNSADNVLLLDGTGKVPSANLPVLNTHGLQVFTANGTLTVPASTIYVTAAAGGGAGGGGDHSSGSYHGTGGGGGETVVRKMLTGLTVGSTVSITIGQGGIGVTRDTGGNGTDTIFGSYFTLKGGYGGVSSGLKANGGKPGGPGGKPGGQCAGVSNWEIPFEDWSIDDTLPKAGAGGGTLISGYTPAPTSGGVVANNATRWGAGGSGARNSATTTPGGSGYQGVVIVEW